MEVINAEHEIFEQHFSFIDSSSNIIAPIGSMIQTI